MAKKKKKVGGLKADFKAARSKKSGSALTLRQSVIRRAIKEAKRTGRGVNVKFASSQSGASKLNADNKLSALHPGVRISKNGKMYYESRKNRSDIGRN